MRERVFRVFVPVAVWAGDRPLALGGPRQVALLAFLLVNATRVVMADALSDAVRRHVPRRIPKRRRWRSRIARPYGRRWTEPPSDSLMPRNPRLRAADNFDRSAPPASDSSGSSRLLAEPSPRCKHELCRFARNAVVMSFASRSDENGASRAAAEIATARPLRFVQPGRDLSGQPGACSISRARVSGACWPARVRRWASISATPTVDPGVAPAFCRSGVRGAMSDGVQTPGSRVSRLATSGCAWRRGPAWERRTPGYPCSRSNLDECPDQTAAGRDRRSGRIS